MAFGVGDAFVSIRPNMGGFESALVSGLTGAFDRALPQVRQLGSELTTKVTLPIAIATAANITQFQALDAKIRETITLFSATGARGARFFDEFREGIGDITESVGLFESQIAPALYQSISSGVPRDNVFTFLETAGQAAVGGALQIESAVNGLTTAVNAFYGADFSRATDAADILFRGVARGKTTFDELSQSMAQAAPLANTAGVSFEEFIAVLATMTLSGTETSVAVTNVRAALTGLLRPSEEMTAIFQEAGFATQDLAVKTLGLQGAAALVADAVDSEVGALITLLGGAEGANAVLQITGENAERFQSVFRDTANATGAMSVAFEQMDEGVGRTFGRMFSQFDRLGSNFGELASTIAVPLVKAITRGLELLNSFVETLIKLPTTLKVIIASFVALAAALGPFILLASKLHFIFGPILVKKFAAFLGAGGLLSKLGAGFKVLGGAIAFMLSRITGLVPALGGLTTALRGVSTRSLAPAIAGVKGFGLAVAGTIGVLAGAALGIELYMRHLERVRSESRIATDQTAILADTLGLVVKPLEELRDHGEISINFRIDNMPMIDALIEAQREGHLEDRLIQIGFSLVTLGNTPEEAFEAIQTIADAAGITIPVDFTLEDLTLDNLLESISTDVDRIASQLGDGIARTVATGRGFDLEVPIELSNATIGKLEDLGGLIAQAFSVDERAGLGALRNLNQELGHIPDAVSRVNRAFLEASGIEDIPVGVTNNWKSLLEFLEEGRFIPPLRNMADHFAAHADAMARAAGIDVPIPFTPEEMQVAAEGMAALTNTIEGVKAGIADRLEEIRDEFTSTIPMFGEFAGAAELNVQKTKDAFDVDDLLTSLEEYNEALRGWAELHETLAGEIPEGLRERLNEMPLEQRAALTKLAEESPTEWQRVLDAYEESFNLSNQLAEDQFQTELPGLIEEGNRIIGDKARELENAMGDIGGDTAEAWARRFAQRAAGWSGTVRFYAEEAERAARNAFQIESPSRVFMEIGEMSALGFEKGLLDNMPDLSKLSDMTMPRQLGSLQPAAQAQAPQGGDVFHLEPHFINPVSHDVTEDARRTIGVLRTATFHRPGGVR